MKQIRRVTLKSSAVLKLPLRVETGSGSFTEPETNDTKLHNLTAPYTSETITQKYYMHCTFSHSSQAHIHSRVNHRVRM